MAKELQPSADIRSEEYVYYYAVSDLTTIRDLTGRAVVEQKSTHSSATDLEPLELDTVPVIIVAEQRVVLPGVNEKRTSEISTHINKPKPPLSDKTVFTMAWHDQLRGKRFNQLMLATCTDPNTFGLDYSDIKEDWGRLYRRDPAYDRVRKLHEDVGRPWWVLDHYGPGQLEAIDYESNAFRLPILRWWVDGNRNRRFIHSNVMFTQEGNRAVNNFLADILPSDFTDTSNSAGPGDTVAGLFYLSYCSPEQMASMPESMDLPHSYERSIGTTQTPLFITRSEDQLAKSPVLPAAETYVGFAV